MVVIRRSETVMTDEDMANTECTIVLLGKTGVGKSSAGNTILHMKSFAAGLSSIYVTKQCQKQSAVISGKKWTVVDTPDYFYSTHDEDLSSEIERSVALSPPGVHAFLFVLKPTTFTEQEADTVSQFQLSYGEEAFRYTMIIFTHGDLLDEDMETLISENESLQSLVSRCGGRFHVLNNKDLSDRQQVYQLLEKINNMVSANGNSCYTLEMLQEAERRAEEQRRRILEEQQRKEERERMEHQANLEKARRETEIRVRKEMDEILEKTRAEIEANQNLALAEEEKKKVSSYDLKHLCVGVFSLVLVYALRRYCKDFVLWVWSGWVSSISGTDHGKDL
ncbi:GTPase IMAP family member 9-like [Trichomycterus rosablanca]|uniref:GTPase IMAP family member 9-like n=1 Tax=Trichomycterus rosablanca TaxID=2290929 RepID=UPI002F351AAC